MTAPDAPAPDRAGASRLARRIAERHARKEAGMTHAHTEPLPDDATLLARFTDLATDTAAFLRGETDAIARGDDAAVAARAPEKQELVARLDDLHHAVAPLVAAGVAEGGPLRDTLDTLRSEVEANAAAVTRRAAAADTVLAELTKIRDRFGLSGLYEKSGQKRGAGSRDRYDERT